MNLWRISSSNNKLINGLFRKSHRRTETGDSRTQSEHYNTCENFQELNQAFVRLIEWQENYKDHITIMNDAFQDALTGINESKVALEAISTASGSIPETMEILRNTDEGFAQQNEQLNEQLSALAQMRTEASEVFSHIGEHLRGVVETIEGSANQFDGLGNHVEQAITSLREQIAQSLVENLLARGYAPANKGTVQQHSGPSDTATE